MDNILKILGGDLEETTPSVIQQILEAYACTVELRYSTLTNAFYGYLNDSDADVVQNKMGTIDMGISHILISPEFKNLSEQQKEIVKKFSDHLLLEIRRKQEYIRQSEVFESNVRDVNKHLERKQQELREHFTMAANEQQETLENNLKEKSQQLEQSLSTNIITVLGIFAAFITAFMGGIGAFGSIMQSINKTNVFRLIFTVFLFGIIYFDTCFSLIYSISRMLGKTIASSNYNPCDNHGFWKKLWFRIIRYPIFCMFNGTMILGMILTVLAFYLHLNKII